MRPTKRTLTIVANAVAQSSGINVVFKGTQACTNGQTIYIPTMSDDDEEALILTSGYLDHEAGHCRHTSFTVEKPREGIQRAFYQSIEDCRMETLQGRQYPGSRTNLSNLVTHLASKDTPPSLFRSMTQADEPAQILQAYVLQRGRFKHVGQEGLGKAFEETRSVIRATLPESLVDEVDRIVDELPSMTSTSDSVDASERLMAAISDAAPDDSNEESNGGEEQDGSQDESGNNDDSDHSDAAGDEEIPDGDAGSDDEDQASSQSGAGDSSTESNDGDSGSSDSESDCRNNLNSLKAAADDSAGQGDDEPQNLGEVVAQQLSEHASSDPDAVRGTFQGDRSENAATAAAVPIDLMKARQGTAKLRQRLSVMLETQGKTRTRHSRTGVKIDRRRLPTISHPNAAVFHTRRKRPTLATAVHVLVDRSGSMERDDRILRAGEAAYALMSATENVDGLTTACSAFPGVGDLAVTPVTRTNESLTRTRHRYIPVSNGTTPLAEALWSCGTDLRAQKANRRILLVVTDGVPDDIDASRAVLSRLRKQGIECLGIGINADTDFVFGEGWAVRINDIKELASKLFSVMQNMLKAA